MRSLLTLLTFAVAVSLSPAATAQFVTFSVDFQGPVTGGPDAFGGVPAINEGQILTTAVFPPPGPNPALPIPTPAPPGVAASPFAGGGGSYPGGLGLPGPPVEVDALSFGFDFGGRILFSVDEFAVGVPTPFRVPNVGSEGQFGTAEASADVFAYLGALKVTPPAIAPGNTEFIDGDGMPAGRGFGLVEPNPPTPGAIPDPGDNLDALDFNTLPAHFGGPIYYSLDSGFLDPVEGLPANLATAATLGFSGADVLVSVLGGLPAVAIPAGALGLDGFGPDTDDLDALLFVDGDLSGGLSAADFIAFSVRRGSAIIGAIDSLQALPIEECDILTVPAIPGGTPSILIPCESLGLGCARAGSFGPNGADDLDALDAHIRPTFTVDFQGPTAGMADAWLGVANTAGGILAVAAIPGLAPVGVPVVLPPGPNPPLGAPIPAPGLDLAAPAGGAAAIPGGLGIVAGGVGGFFEMDALSYGRDQFGGQLVFSVDEFAVGLPFPGMPTANGVATEGGIAGEASADVFEYRGALVPLPIPALPYVSPTNGNLQLVDGEGLGTLVGGIGLSEPNPPTPGAVPDVGDNLDGLDLDTRFTDILGPVFFSLDSLLPDPIEGLPVNNGTAFTTGLAAVGVPFSGADVLLSFAGGMPIVAVPALTLGLDILGVGTDDLDALAFFDADGTLTYTPGDTLLFSVRRGSGVIGVPESGPSGAPISEGDVLTPPPLPGIPPVIAVNAEALGLATIRSGLFPVAFDDDLDGLDLLAVPEPGGLLMLALGCGALALLGRRRGTR